MVIDQRPDGLTAFDVARDTRNGVIPALFYKNMFDRDLDGALLRLLTATPDPEKAPSSPVRPYLVRSWAISCL